MAVIVTQRIEFALDEVAAFLLFAACWAEGNQLVDQRLADCLGADWIGVKYVDIHELRVGHLSCGA